MFLHLCNHILNLRDEQSLWVVKEKCLKNYAKIAKTSLTSITVGSSYGISGNSILTNNPI